MKAKKPTNNSHEVISLKDTTGLLPKLQRIAKDEDRSVSFIVRRLLTEGLEEKQRE